MIRASCGRPTAGPASTRRNASDIISLHLCPPASKSTAACSVLLRTVLQAVVQTPLESRLAVGMLCACRHAGHSRVRFVGLNQTKLLYHIWKRGRRNEDSDFRNWCWILTFAQQFCRFFHIMCSAAAASGGGSNYSGVSCILFLVWCCMVPCVQVSSNVKHACPTCNDAFMPSHAHPTTLLLCRLRSRCVNGFNGFVSAFIFATETQQTIGTDFSLLCQNALLNATPCLKQLVCNANMHCVIKSATIC